MTRWPADRLVGIAEDLGRQPEIVRLDGGPAGSVAARLPGRTIAGLRVLSDERLEVHVVMSSQSTVDGVETALGRVLGTDRDLADLVITDLEVPGSEHGSGSGDEERCAEERGDGE